MQFTETTIPYALVNRNGHIVDMPAVILVVEQCSEAFCLEGFDDTAIEVLILPLL